MTLKTDRNRVIFDAFQAGRTIEQIGEDYALTWNRVRAILTDERHRRTVSPEPFYRALRKG